MLSYKIDHVVFAHPDLDEAVKTFIDMGFAPVPGGRHGSGATQNALIPFADGSYIELLARTDEGGVSPLWEEPLASHAGWCDWCLGVPDMEQAAGHLRGAGLSLKGPFAMHRERPGDLPRAAWELAFVRQESAGGALPFIIQDTSPRENRVPTASEGGAYSGIRQVIVAVPDVEEWQERFRRYFGLPELDAVPRPDITDVAANEAAFTGLQGTPVILAKPFRDGALSARLTHFGPMLCGVILRGRDTCWLASDFSRGLVVGTTAE